MIKLSSNKCQTLFENKIPIFNISTYFVYPLLDIPSYYSSFLKDTYLYSFNFPNYKNKKVIFLLYKFLEIDSKNGLEENYHYLQLNDFLNKNDNFFSNYNLKDYYSEELKNIKDDYICYIFNIPNKFKNDYDCFLKGEYSKFSLSAKERITEKYNYSLWGDICKIFKKDKNRKIWLEDYLDVNLPDGAELGALYEEDKETLTINKIIEI